MNSSVWHGFISVSVGHLERVQVSSVIDLGAETSCAGGAAYPRTWTTSPQRRGDRFARPQQVIFHISRRRCERRCRHTTPGTMLTRLLPNHGFMVVAGNRKSKLRPPRAWLGFRVQELQRGLRYSMPDEK
jgi:hypothetical protein